MKELQNWGPRWGYYSGRGQGRPLSELRCEGAGPGKSQGRVHRWTFATSYICHEHLSHCTLRNDPKVFLKAQVHKEKPLG